MFTQATCKRAPQIGRVGSEIFATGKEAAQGRVLTASPTNSLCLIAVTILSDAKNKSQLP